MPNFKDERKVRQVVLNLLSNAVKFTPQGSRIEVRAVSVDGAVEVSVAPTPVSVSPLRIRRRLPVRPAE